MSGSLELFNLLISVHYTSTSVYCVCHEGDGEREQTLFAPRPWSRSSSPSSIHRVHLVLKNLLRIRLPMVTERFLGSLCFRCQRGTDFVTSKVASNSRPRFTLVWAPGNSGMRGNARVIAKTRVPSPGPPMSLRTQYHPPTVRTQHLASYRYHMLCAYYAPYIHPVPV